MSTYQDTCCMRRILAGSQRTQASWQFTTISRWSEREQPRAKFLGLAFEFFGPALLTGLKFQRGRPPYH